ncbi:MAG: hypothetical protein L3K52_02710 [Candidatus Thiothrix sulfatifontis]|nr:MAG: hypothetical protein L3K52_02710 [Candidatus Thiothrix sulfatifontis]
MQKIIWFCGVALLCLATSLAAAVPPPSPPAATATTPPAEPVNVLSAAKQAGVLRVAMEPDFPPCIGLTKKARKTVSITTWRYWWLKSWVLPTVQAVEDDYSKLPGLAVEG